MPQQSKSSKRNNKKQNDRASSRRELSREILEEIREHYYKASDSKAGLEEFAKDVGTEKLHPRNRVTVMILGNHSSGKSSFVNWYCDDQKLRRTAVAIESKSFTLITHGKEKDKLDSLATIEAFPHIRDILDIKGMKEGLETVTSCSTSRHFEMVDFIDTPGLVDGNYSYSFDVNRVILELAEHVDLVLVFLDPQTGGLCNRTMTVVEEINKKYYEKMHVYITKIDILESAKDLMKVQGQVDQQLHPRLSKGTHGFETHAMFIPKNGRDVEGKKWLTDDLNEIDRLCEDIYKCIGQKVQKNLKALKKDCDDISALSKEMLKQDDLQTQKVRKLALYKYLTFACLWIILPLLTSLFCIEYFKDYVPDALLENEAYGSIKFVGEFIVDSGLPTKHHLYIFVGTFVLLFGLSKFAAMRHRSQSQKLLGKDRRSKLSKNLKSMETINTRYVEMHRKFIKSRIHEDTPLGYAKAADSSESVNVDQ